MILPINAAVAKKAAQTGQDPQAVAAQQLVSGAVLGALGGLLYATLTKGAGASGALWGVASGGALAYLNLANSQVRPPAPGSAGAPAPSLAAGLKSPILEWVPPISFSSGAPSLAAGLGHVATVAPPTPTAEHASSGLAGGVTVPWMPSHGPVFPAFSPDLSTGGF